MRPCLKRKSWVLFLNIYLVVESVTIPPNEMTCWGGEACLPLGKWRPSPLYSSGFVLNPGKMIRGRKALETSTQLQSCLDDHWSGPRAGTHGPLFLHLLPGVQVTLEKPGMATVGTYLWPHRVRPPMRTLDLCVQPVRLGCAAKMGLFVCSVSGCSRQTALPGTFSYRLFDPKLPSSTVYLLSEAFLDCTGGWL